VGIDSEGGGPFLLQIIMSALVWRGCEKVERLGRYVTCSLLLRTRPWSCVLHWTSSG